LVWTNYVLDIFRNLDVDPATIMESFRVLKKNKKMMLFNFTDKYQFTTRLNFELEGIKYSSC
jgi:hypothetical protein